MLGMRESLAFYALNLGTIKFRNNGNSKLINVFRFISVLDFMHFVKLLMRTDVYESFNHERIPFLLYHCRKRVELS